jgi:phage terminase large subunit
MWLFWPGAAVGWGSRKEPLVDRIGDMTSVFEKLRSLVHDVPECFLPAGFRMKDHATFMRILNPENGAAIIGEVGDNIGRGGRSLVYFIDEAGFSLLSG